MKRLATPLLAAAIFLLGVLLNAPLFLPGEMPFRGSIEGGYAATARFVGAHPNPWGWNPLQYCGLPTQFLYLPGLPYLSAAVAWLLPHAAPEHVYRVLTALLACLGPVAVFFFALRFTGSRRWSLAAAMAFAFLSPAYGLFPQVEKDRGIVQLPWHVQVLAKYGEGPHNAGLALMPLTLLAVWLAATGRRYATTLTAAVLLAAVALTNWVSALSLAIAFLLLLLAAAGEPEFRAWRALAAAALAYLLACFWLTPTFIRTIAFNWPTDSFGYQLRDRQQWLLAGLVVGVLALRLVFRWLRGSFYFSFVTLCAFTFGWIATGFYLYGVDTIPESRRYALEFELFLILALAEAFRLTLKHPNQTVRMCAIGAGGLMLLAGAPQIWAYTTEGWDVWRPSPKEETVEHRLGNWLAARQPSGRVFASGGLRFRLNAWFDLPQVGGGFESGLRNRMPVDLAYKIRTGTGIEAGREARDTVLMLKALGVEYVVVHGPQSKEYYRDFHDPGRLESALPLVFREGADSIYSLPPRPLAHLVSREELPEKDAQARPWVLEPYVAAMEDASRPALRARWSGASTLAVDGEVPSGRLVAVKVSWDPGWRATQDGRPIAIEPDKLGFMALAARPAPAAHIELRYGGTAEQRVMAGVSGLAWAAALLALFRRRRQIRA